jgi:cold shock CspA family protein
MNGGMSGQMNGSSTNFPSMGNFEIGTFNISNSSSRGHEGGGNGGQTTSRNNGYQEGGQQSNNGPPGPGHRETGIIEKLLHSYGFIQCCDRQARLFFHFSQFGGNIEHLKIGDPVEFEMTYDRRTGKPIASTVSKIAPEVVLREERVIGTVTTEARIDPETGGETQGRISYENRGECFFLPFTMSDVEGNVTVAAGDKVSFQMATMARSGNLVARTIRLENPAAPVKYQGVVNSIQDDKTYGFIERADVVREIFFRNSDLEVGENIDLGDNVEFTIQTRNGKEVATNIIKLLPGTVVFEDVGTEYFRGQVLKPIDRNYRPIAEGDALSGRVKYRGQDRSEKEVQFGETDQVGDFTLKHGDWIKFVIAVDRRDKHPRATRIELLDESFKVSDERREQGTINNTKEGFGFIQCADRDAKIFFHFSECLDVSRQPREGDDCEFTVADDPNHAGQLMATRIKLLPPGTVQFAVTIHQDAVGKVEVEPTKTSWTKNGSNSSTSSSPAKEGIGKIIYELNGLSLEIPLHANDCDLRDFPRKGDIVRFDINQLKSTKETNAINIRIIETQHPRTTSATSGGAIVGTGNTLASAGNSSAALSTGSDDIAEIKNSADGEQVQQGYIAALKDGFGFIETISHDKEIFFHFSNVESKPERLEVGLEVEYTVFNRDKGGKVSAENVKLLRKGTIAPISGKEEVLHGKVVRPLRSVNPDQNDYCGLIQVKNEDGSVLIDYRFGIASLINKKELLQVNDPVQFSADVNEEFAVNIHATREKLRAMVEAMKGQYGFLSYEVDEGRKLFFHTSEVEGGESLQEGDEVEFVVITNKRTGKHSACCVRKLSSSKRPERLISKLKAMNLEDANRLGKKITVVRQPKGPDGSKGFVAKRAYL